MSTITGVTFPVPKPLMPWFFKDKKTVFTPLLQSPSPASPGIPGGDGCGYSCTSPQACQTPAWVDVVVPEGILTRFRRSARFSRVRYLPSQRRRIVASTTSLDAFRRDLTGSAISSNVSRCSELPTKYSELGFEHILPASNNSSRMGDDRAGSRTCSAPTLRSVTAFSRPNFEEPW